ncbi:cation transporter [Paracoccus tegillarcae]|uniref:Cation transporter n=1 Tax=Paracoccus tegillarcae TaxID=1529068 RepID=A0A2K9EZV5_9RHOB|nr:cation transporter [Paracoccus tegillarcae]AUH34844.1 cation transporter [Paracoccus tegillarcae]
MTSAAIQDTRTREARSLTIAMWGNLFMAAAGLLAGFLSNSGAIMVDGLFSMIGFLSALLARRISRKLDAGPDRLRPYGYAADEAIFVTFRSLSLLGLVLFAVTAAAKNIFDYMTGSVPEPLIFGPMIGYFSLIGATCFALWATHYRAWLKTGRKSDILQLEARAAAFDGLITAAAGMGLGLIYLLRDGPLGGLAPIGDSLIVLLLCLTVVGQYYGGFRAGLSELAGVTASPERIARARRAMRPALVADGGKLLDMSVMKLGRSFQVTVYYDPGRPITAEQIDTLNLRLQHGVQPTLPGGEVLLFITRYPRRWPGNMPALAGTPG